MLNYIDIIGNYYPGTICYSAGDPADYNSIVWDSTPISQAELDATYLIDYKTKKIIEFSEQAKTEITSGFASSALGTLHWYDSETEDQLNLIGAVTTNTDMAYACRNSTANDTKEYKIHTHNELLTVINAGKDIKLAALQKFNVKREQITVAANQTAVDAIVWE